MPVFGHPPLCVYRPILYQTARFGISIRLNKNEEKEEIMTLSIWLLKIIILIKGIHISENYINHKISLELGKYFL